MKYSSKNLLEYFYRCALLDNYELTVYNHKDKSSNINYLIT